MKELQMGQEIILFQDAIRSASSGGLDFSSNDLTMIEKSSQVVLDILRYVKEICEEDRKCVFEIEENLHRLLINKTLLSSDSFKDEERRQFYSHGCESLPSIGWGVYVQSVLICNWLDFANNSWSEDSVSTRLYIYENILTAINKLSNLDVLNLFYLIVTKYIDILTGNECSADCISNEVLKHVISCLENSILSEKNFADSSNFLIKLLTYFCVKLKNSVTVLDLDIAKNFLQSLATLTLLAFKKLPENNKCKTNLMSCSSAINTLLLQDQTNGLLTLRTLQANINKNVNFKYENEEEMIKDISLVDSQEDEFENSSLQRLLDNLKISSSDKIFDCFLRNYAYLKPNHVKCLFELKLIYSDTATVNTINKIVEQTYKNWTLEEQDKFRQEFTGSVSDINIDEQLTKVFNVLSSSSESSKLNNIIITLSYMCFIDPKKTLIRLMSFAVESGQDVLAVKILSHFTSCQRSTDGRSLSILTMVLQDLVYQDMNFQEFENFLKLIRELVQKVQIIEFAQLLIRNIQCNNVCSKVLTILKEIIERSNDEEMFQQIKLSVFYLQLGKVLHHCMVTNLIQSSINILSIRQNVMELLQCTIEKYKSLDNIKHQLCWLFSRLEKLHPTIIFHFIEISHLFSYEKRFLIKVKSLCLSHVLIVGCCCPSNIEKFWGTYFCKAKKNSLNYETLCCSVAQLLLRLTGSELKHLPNVITFLFPFCQLDTLPQPLIVIQLLTEALLLLRQSSSNANELYFQQATANCSTLVSDILKDWHSVEPYLWISIVSFIASLIKHFDSSKCFQLLLIDLLSARSNEFDNTSTKAIFIIVERLEIVELISNTSKLLKMN